jgi:hypothetical protein
MTKLPPNAKRVIVNGNPSIEHTNPVTGKIRLERDVETELARLPKNQQIAKRKAPPQKWRKAEKEFNA